jgi:hypothetical protein
VLLLLEQLMLDAHDRKELQIYLRHCVTRAQLMTEYPITPGMFKNAPKHIWRQGQTVLYDRDEFLLWYESRRYKHWTVREVKKLIEMVEKGNNWSTIAFALGRTMDSCRSKWKKVMPSGVSTGEQEDKAS